MWQQCKLCQLQDVAHSRKGQDRGIIEMSAWDSEAGSWVLVPVHPSGVGICITSCAHPSCQAQSNFLTLPRSYASTTILQSSFCWLRNIEAILNCEYRAMLENIYTATTPTRILVPVHPHSDSQHHSIPFVAWLWPVVLNTSVAAKRTLDTSTTTTAPPHHCTPKLLPLAHISLASADCPQTTRACPSGYKLNFRICLEIHLLNYFTQQTNI